MLTALGAGSAIVAGLAPPIPTVEDQRMRIRILRGTVCDGATRAVGEIVDANERDARVLLNLGKAVAVDADAAQDAPGGAQDATPDEPPADAPKRRGRPPRAAQ